jgi:two-component system phosphate regulon sensor histidine kinase PhoR
LRSSKDTGLPISALIRHPTFTTFIAQPSFDQSIDLPSPINDAIMLRMRIVPFGKKQHLLLATDITQIHRLEQIRRDFVANVSHELRTPLTVIGGYLETLRESGDICAERWQQPLQRMQQQSSRMSHIIEDLLFLSRLEIHAERPPERPVPVPTMLEAIAEEAMALSGERAHEIEILADPETWVIGNEQELRAAFSNLIFNAVRHTPAGSHIIIRWFTDPQGIFLEVEDDGDGVPAEHLSRITERFYRVDGGRKRASGGTGLGLAIVKHVMNNHDGRLSITSLVGVGSLFACHFPSRRRTLKALPPVTSASG